jgi:hypothetical protein
MHIIHDLREYFDNKYRCSIHQAINSFGNAQSTQFRTGNVDRKTSFSDRPDTMADLRFAMDHN